MTTPDSDNLPRLPDNLPRLPDNLPHLLDNGHEPPSGCAHLVETWRPSLTRIWHVARLLVSTQRLDSATALSDCTQRLDPATAPSDCAQRLHSATALGGEGDNVDALAMWA
ncbi:hypothetical protein E2P81_ATG05356 [Venturia nashicola]|nr:hypothetical protein E2P81_ATG05356 [Venturia nashicola]